MLRKIRTQLTIVDKCKVTLGGQSIWYTIKHSTRARYVRLEIRQGMGLTIVIPESYEIKQLPELLERKKGWILDKLSKYGGAKSLSAVNGLKSGDYIPYLGRDLELLIRQNNHRADSVRLEENGLVVSISFTDNRLNLMLEGWYRTQAARLIGKRVFELSNQLGVTYNWLIMRGQKTRWGSCSQNGTLSFNWRMIMAPEPVIDYVIIHELSHRKEMNHTRQFWKLVAEQCPQWREHRKWLKEHGADLMSKLA
ncbi:M48 family metallopeptidase [Chloroflexota bacterium]